MDPFGYALRHGDQPGWYDLLTSRYGLTITMPPSVFKDLQALMETDRFLRVHDGLALPPYIPPLAQRWGFGGNAEVVLQRDLAVLRFPFPRHVGAPSESRNYNALHAVLAAFTLTTNALMAVGDTTVWNDRQQILTINGVLIAPRGSGNASIEAWISGAATRWIIDFASMPNHPYISEAMRLAYQRMTQEKISTIEAHHLFQCRLDPSGRMVLICPGQACGLSPERSTLDAIRGGRLTSNNVDSPLQALTLLAGLAAFNMAVRTSTTP